MRFVATPIPGAFVVEMERIEDERGFFARSWCASEFAAHGMAMRPEQCSVSYNRARGTLRGMHYQAAPHEEAKLIRCTRGAIYDVIVDARERSSAKGWHFSITLSAGGDAMLYVPEGVAHGFVTLADDTEIAYCISKAYEPTALRGFRWDDPAVGIEWPVHPICVSSRDAALPSFVEREAR